MRADINFRFASKVLRIAVIWVVGASVQSAEPPNPGPLPAAKQIGVSCGFFANVPAVTLATGVNIHASESFLKSIYGLRRGDFSYRSSFDKRMFYELFSLPYVETKITHPPGSPQTMMENSRMIITEIFHNGLSNGQIYSLRVRGVFNGPHNTLLLGRSGNGYVLHDPFPGTIETVGLDQLASRMLVRSTLGKNREKNIYVTHFLTIDLPPRPRGQIIPVSSLPTSLEVSLSSGQRSEISTTLRTGQKPAAGAGIDEFIGAYPEIDFAALPGDGKGGKARNVIGNDLKTKDLAGLLNLAKFTLNTWEQKRRPLLPVLLLNGQPQVLIGYRTPDSTDLATATLVFDDGRSLQSLSTDDALVRIKKAGAIYGTLRLDQD